MERCVVQREANGRDRISQLPVKILDQIMGLLPIWEAAKTAALSKVWRDVWFSLTQLCFDSQFFRYFDKKNKLSSKDVGRYSCLYVITKVLLQHKGSIRKFVIIHSWVETLTVRSQSFHMSQWLFLVTRLGVEEIKLHFRSKEYKLPDCTFSCSTLTRLHLCSLSIEPLSSPCTLPNVTSLLFEHVRFGTRSLSNYVVDTPKLMNLSFLHCEDVFHFDITARNLYSLTIRGFYGSKLGLFLPGNMDLISISTLDIDIHILEHFHCRYTTKELLLQLPSLNVEHLKLPLLCFQHDAAISAFACLLCKCPKLSKLEIGFSRVVDKTKCIDATSEHLKNLRSVARTHQMLSSMKLSNFDGSRFQMHFIQEMLACLPALEKVVITRYPLIYDWNKEHETMEEISHFPRASAKANIVYQ